MSNIDSGLLTDRFAKAADIYRHQGPVRIQFSGRAALLLAADVSADHEISSSAFRIGAKKTDDITKRRIVNGISDMRLNKLAEPAPWMAVTLPTGPLLKDRSHPLASENSPESLLPHSNAWAQSVYLATTFRLNQLKSWTEKHYPEWLDESGSISPFSMANPIDDEESDQLRGWLLAELSFLRELEKHGQFFIQHHTSGESAFNFSGLGQNLQVDDPENQSQIEFWQRNGAGEAELFRSQVPGKDDGWDERLYTQQAQVLAWLAELKKLSMEQARYKDTDDSDRSLLLFRSDWLTAERVLLLDRLLTRYVVDGGLDIDATEYAQLCREHSQSNDIDEKIEAELIKSDIQNGIAQANIVLQHLGRHVKGQQAADLAQHYLLSERRDVTAVTPVRNAVTSMERFGLSVNPHRIDANLAQKLSGIAESHDKRRLNRGYQPWSQAEIKKVAFESGHLSNAFQGEIGLSVLDKISKQEAYIREAETFSNRQEKDLAHLNQSIQILKSQEREIRNYAERMEKWSESAKSQNQQLRRESFEKRVMIGLLADMLTESRMLFNQQAADFMGQKLPASSEKSHLAEVLMQEGFQIDVDAMRIVGMPTTDESFDRMKSQREEQVEKVLSIAASSGAVSHGFAKSAVGASKDMADDLMIGKRKPSLLRSLFVGDDESEAGQSSPRFM